MLSGDRNVAGSSGENKKAALLFIKPLNRACRMTPTINVETLTSPVVERQRSCVLALLSVDRCHVVVVATHIIAASLYTRHFHPPYTFVCATATLFYVRNGYTFVFPAV